MVLVLFVYLGLFTWNLRTGQLDTLAAHTGLEFTGLVLKPGKWLSSQVTGFWNHYIHLVDVRRHNDELQAQLHEAAFQLAKAKEEEAELKRLRGLLTLSPPTRWERIGARVIAHRLGAQAALESIMLNKGYMGGGAAHTPVVTHMGVVGRILRAGPYTSSALLITDASSRVAVISRDNRIPGILTGNGPRAMLQLKYIPLNAPLAEGEFLLTSGLGGAFPKGLPIARIVSIEHSDISLFLTVNAEPLASLDGIEEVLLLKEVSDSPDATQPVESSSEATAPVETSATKPQ